MKLIVGLGNPGAQYAKTKHNIGFMLIDQLCDQWNMGPFSQDKKFHGWTTQGVIHGEKIIFLKPSTYMNKSGTSIGAITSYYNIPAENVLIIHDEIDFPTAKITLKKGGSHAGHNGLRDTINHLGTRDFRRLRIGINRPNDSAMVSDYVLSSFSTKQKEDIQDQREKIIECAEKFLRKDE